MSGEATSQSQIITMMERPCPIGDQATEFGSLVDPTAVVPRPLAQKRSNRSSRRAADVVFRLTATLLLGVIGILMGAIASELMGRIS